MYKYKRFCEIYDHQLLKTRALKRVKPKMVGSYWTQGHPKPGSWLELYLGLSRRKDRVLVGFKLLKSRLWTKQLIKSYLNNSCDPSSFSFETSILSYKKRIGWKSNDFHTKMHSAFKLKINTNLDVLCNLLTIFT